MERRAYVVTGNECADLLRSCARLADATLNRMLAPLQLNLGRVVFLRTAARLGDGIAVNDLAVDVACSKQNASSHVMRLVCAGFATTEMDEDDLRVRRVKVTEDGKEAIALVAERLETFDRLVTQALEPQEAEAFAGLLLKFREFLQRRDVEMAVRVMSGSEDRDVWREGYVPREVNQNANAARGEKPRKETREEELERQSREARQREREFLESQVREMGLTGGDAALFVKSPTLYYMEMERREQAKAAESAANRAADEAEAPVRGHDRKRERTAGEQGPEGGERHRERRRRRRKRRRRGGRRW